MASGRDLPTPKLTGHGRYRLCSPVSAPHSEPPWSLVPADSPWPKAYGASSTASRASHPRRSQPTGIAGGAPAAPNAAVRRCAASCLGVWCTGGRCKVLPSRTRMGRLMLVFAVVCASTAAASAAEAAAPTYVATEFTGALIRPSQLSFSTDGDLTAIRLRWRAWGTPAATATGTFRFRTSPHMYVIRHGRVTLTNRQVLCPGSPLNYFYAKALFHVPQSPWRLPEESLGPPTSGYTCHYELGPGQ